MMHITKPTRLAVLGQRADCRKLLLGMNLFTNSLECNREASRYSTLEKFCYLMSKKKGTILCELPRKEHRGLQYQFTPQHLVRLLQVIVDGNCDLTVPQVASIHFKNPIGKNWAPHEPRE
ncbi:uncharacterized protein LOC131069610 isoform X2 [Cryptomeria japonica]|nr:uncharacterized protein LOC131069610 isoform X2 [Cryptomeria japonica]